MSSSAGRTSNVAQREEPSRTPAKTSGPAKAVTRSPYTSYSRPSRTEPARRSVSGTERVRPALSRIWKRG